MKHYAVTMATTTGQNIRVVYKTFSEKAAGAAAKRKTDFLELIKVEECEAPVSRAKANRRYWVITCLNTQGRRMEIFSTGATQNNIRSKMAMHPHCDTILKIEETCESDYTARKAKKI